MFNRVVGAVRVVGLLKAVQAGPSVQRIAVSPLCRPLLRFCSSQQPASTGNSKDKAKIRRMYAMGGCVMFMWVGIHGILLYRRRSEHRELDAKLPPMPWDQFVEQFFSGGQVKSIVYQPQFGTGNVYLHSENEQKMKKNVTELFHISAPDKFSRPPDVRFWFDGDQKEVEKAIVDAQKAVTKLGGTVNEVDFSVDQFPSYRELSFIVVSTLLAVGAMLK